MNDSRAPFPLDKIGEVWYNKREVLIRVKVNLRAPLGIDKKAIV